jgi:8-oxo-dGTP pyrophosphatase MutT (NUDIX family)
VLQSESSPIKILLREALKISLPGEKAHRLMLPSGRELYPEVEKTTIIQSSVLMLIFPFNGEMSTCLIRRPSQMRNHGGQIAFPGGRYEHADNNLLTTALRESSEEIGTIDHQLEIIGALTPIYVQVSNFSINPFIGWSDTLPQFKTDNQEVDELFIVPINQLLHPQITQFRKVETKNGTFDVPGFYLDPLFVWGATAMIISEFNEVYRSLTTE